MRFLDFLNRATTLSDGVWKEHWLGIWTYSWLVCNHHCHVSSTYCMLDTVRILFLSTMNLEGDIIGPIL